MDIILNLADKYITPYIYPSEWSETTITRQFFSLMMIVLLSGYFLYFITAGLNFLFIFDKKLLKHPLILENQIWKEISVASSSVPLMTFLSVCCFLLEVRGYSKLYEFRTEQDQKYTLYGSEWLFVCFSMITFIMFTDCLIYWIHKTLHTKYLYKHLHKTHHLWKIPTPFASHALHPIDGFLQSLPYHIYVFLFPMHKFAYLFMFLMVNIWTVSIHDGDFRVPRWLRPVVNGSAHHTDHHLYYNYNYGQFFTFWDRVGGSFRNPSVYSVNNDKQ